METGERINEIDVSEFLKLYINHRPVFCTLNAELEWAFSVLGTKKNGVFKIDREKLLWDLMTRGEKMKDNELTNCLNTLHKSPMEAGNCRMGEHEDFNVEDSLPSSVSLQDFMDLINIYE